MPLKRRGMPLGLVPEVLNAVDVAGLVGEALRVVDAQVMELGNVQHVIGRKAVGIDDGIGPDLVANDWEKRVGTGVWDHDGVDLAAPLQQPEDRNLAGGGEAALAFPRPAGIALVDLDLCGQQFRRFGRSALGDALSQPVEEQGRRMPVDPGQRGGRPRRRAGDEMLDQLVLDTWPQPAAPPCRNHLSQIAFPSYLGQPL